MDIYGRRVHLSEGIIIARFYLSLKIYRTRLAKDVAHTVGKGIAVPQTVL